MTPVRRSQDERAVEVDGDPLLRLIIFSFKPGSGPSSLFLNSEIVCERETKTQQDNYMREREGR